MSIFEEFEQKGIEKGIKKGISQVMKVIKLWLEGTAIPDIAKSVDLPVEQIEIIIANFQSEN